LSHHKAVFLRFELVRNPYKLPARLTHPSIL